MPFKQIVCLANSKKNGQRCIAGKELGTQDTGKWIRPVSPKTETGELTLAEMSFPDGSSPNVLDIITVPLLEHSQHYYQTENYFVNPAYYWVKNDVLPPEKLASLCDNPSALWLNGSHSSGGVNDRIPEDVAKTQVTTSLLLIRPEYLLISHDEEYGKQRIRADFIYKSLRYCLIVTDPTVLAQTLGRDIGIYLMDGRDVYLCLSLGEPFQGYCYKLVAGILPHL